MNVLRTTVGGKMRRLSDLGARSPTVKIGVNSKLPSTAMRSMDSRYTVLEDQIKMEIVEDSVDRGDNLATKAHLNPSKNVWASGEKGKGVTIAVERKDKRI